MPTLGNVKVNSYRAGVFADTSSSFSRFIMLQLDMDPPQIIKSYFGKSPLPDGKFYPLTLIIIKSMAALLQNLNKAFIT